MKRAGGANDEYYNIQASTLCKDFSNDFWKREL
jgi:hypothetical protein